jgi:2-dehydropantoate 2-reductase
VLFTCKAYDLDSAMDAIAPAMKGACVVLPMLNGLAHFDRLDERFGSAHVLGGTCQINATLKPDGTVVHGDKLQRMLFGERDGSLSPRTGAFAEDLGRTKIDWRRSKDIQQDLWEKIVFLSALAATTCLFRGNVREIMAAPGGAEAMERALAANIAIATAEGRPPRDTAVESARARLMDREGLWSASMLRDLEGGGAVEADHIVGWMLERARRHGIDDTVLSMAYTHLKAYEARRAAARLG